MALTVFPVKAERKNEKFDIFETVEDTLRKNKQQLQDGDVLVISSKYVSNSQGRLVNIENVKSSEQGKLVSKKFQIKPKIAEVIVRESDVIFGGVSGFVITSSDNILAPNAGIDKSNAKKAARTRKRNAKLKAEARRKATARRRRRAGTRRTSRRRSSTGRRGASRRRSPRRRR